MSEHPPVCPECVQGKHINCDGQAWDSRVDEITDCQCEHSSHGA